MLVRNGTTGMMNKSTTSPDIMQAQEAVPMPYLWTLLLHKIRYKTSGITLIWTLRHPHFQTGGVVCQK